MRYVHLPAGSVDTQLLEDATRRGQFVPFCDVVTYILLTVLQKPLLSRPRLGELGSL